MKLFELLAEIIINTDKSDAALDKTDKNAASLGDKLSSMAKTAGGWGLAIGAGATAAAGALGGMATKAADSLDRIDKMSQKLGLSKKGFQELDYIMGQNGISIDSMGAGMKTLVNQFDELGKGGAVATDAFSALGLSYDDLAGKSQEDILYATISALQGVEDETKRAALANDLLGRSGQELAPLLNAGAENMDQLRQRAHELGLVMGDDAVNAGVIFGDTLDDLKNSFGAAVTQIGIQVMPMFQRLADWVLANMPMIQEIMSKAFDFIGKAVQFVWDVFANYLLPVMQSIFTWVSENWPTISAIIGTAFEAIKLVWDEVLAPVLGLLWEGIKKVVDLVADHFPKMQETAQKVFENIGNAVQTVVDVFVKVRDAIKDAWEWLGKWQERDAKSSANVYSPASYGGSYGAGVNGTGGTIGGALPAMQARNERRNENGTSSMNVNINVKSPYDVLNELRVLDKSLAAGVR